MNERREQNGRMRERERIKKYEAIISSRVFPVINKHLMVFFNFMLIVGRRKNNEYSMINVSVRDISAPIYLYVSICIYLFIYIYHLSIIYYLLCLSVIYNLSISIEL